MIDILRAVAALILVMGIIAACVWGGRHLLRPLRRTTRSGTTSAPVVLGGVWLDTRRKLVAIRWGNKEHLICIGPGGERRIASRPTEKDAQ